MEWTMYDCAIVFGIALIVLELYILARVIICRHKKKSTIYWDDKEQQIKTRDEKCLYDVNRMSVEAIRPFIIGNGERITKIEQEREQIQEYNRKIEEDENERDEKDAGWESKIEAQLQCGAKGHKMVYAKKDLCFHRNSPQLTGYYFKCSNCGLEITRTAKELTVVEKEALKKLKLL